MAVDNDLDAGDRFGPAMAALPERPRKFVLALLEQKKPDYAKAARWAGYSDVANGCKVRGHHLAHDARVIAALHEEAAKRFKLLGWMGVRGLAKIAADPKHPDYYKANKDLADRFGFAAVMEHKVVREEKRATPAEKLQEVKELCEFLGVPFDPARFLGLNAVEPRLIEGQFEVVPK